MNQAKLRDTGPGQLDAARQQRAADATPLHVRIDGERTEGRDRTARVQPGHPDDLAVDFGHQTAQRIERQQVPHVAPGVRGRSHHRWLRVAQRDLVERQEIHVPGAVGIPLLERPDGGLDGALAPLAQ